MYHIFNYFTKESYFGKQVKDIRSELDQAKRDITNANLNHDSLKQNFNEVNKE